MFDTSDLLKLDMLFRRADEVVAMREVHAGEHDPLVIGLRHDMDNQLEPSVELAEWEAERGYRATYFVLHDSGYWDAPDLRPALERIAELGHEVGLHANGIAEAITTGRDPDEIIHSALERLRGWGHHVTGVVAHGDERCYQHNGELAFVNDEQFTDCARPEVGAPDRRVVGTHLTLAPAPLASFGLEYEANRLGRALYLSDSGGVWSEPFDEMAERFPSVDGQLHVLTHPCHWTPAFIKEAVA